MQGCKRHNGLTLIEILVVISTSALLIGILLPSLNRVRQQAKRTVCLSNLRQMSLAAHTYSAVYDDYYPLAYYTDRVNGIRRTLAWDFNSFKDWSQSEPVERIEPGLLWMGTTIEKIQQCPSFNGAANWLSDPFTGYNYNTSYIGRNDITDPIITSARTTEVRTPAQTALFGDGEYSNGANKFMRAPFPNPRDASFSMGRYAGGQGFRHLHTTNVAFCDGHADSLRDVHTDTDEAGHDILETYNQTAEVQIGFLSSDNSLYDLK